MDNSITAMRIRILRVKLNMSQAQFANLLGVNAATVSRWENGHLQPETSTQATLIALERKVNDMSEEQLEAIRNKNKQEQKSNTWRDMAVGAGLFYLITKLFDD